MRVAVVGGGIAGVAAAHRLHRSRPDADIDLFEGSGRLGGKLLLGSVAGITVDVGAESLLNRRPEGVDLVRRVGLADRVVHPESVSAAIWTRGALRPLPSTVMGIPADLDALRASGIVAEGPSLCESGATTPQTHGDRRGLSDMSVGDFVRERLGADFGSEIVDRLVEPLLGGVYAGHADRLSLNSAAPQIGVLGDGVLGDDLIASAAKQVRRNSEAGSNAGPLFAGLDGGLGQLPALVAEASGAAIHLGSTVRAVERRPHGWRLTVGPTVAAKHVDVDALIIATPGPATARLLAAAAPSAAEGIAGIEYASMAIVTLALPQDGFARMPRGSGFLVPPVDGKKVKAATFSTNKWAWLARDAGPGLSIIRCSIGRAGEASDLQRDDQELIDFAVADLSEALGPAGAPVDALVQRWGGALPQYDVGHAARIDAAMRSVATVPGIEVCGAAYAGLGIPAVIASAQDAAGRLLAGLDTMGS